MRINEGGGAKSPTKPLNKDASFKARDVNKDGELTGAELKGLKKMDADQSKSISKDEFLAGTKAARQAQHAENREQAFNKLDKNDDGILSGNEKAKLKKFDKDGDGEITKEEHDAGRKEQWRAKMDQKFDDLFEKLDVTDEGVLSGTETKKRKDWDADGDGKITKDEAKAGWQADRKEAKEKEILGGAKKAEKEEKEETTTRRPGPQPV